MKIPKINLKQLLWQSFKWFSTTPHLKTLRIYIFLTIGGILALILFHNFRTNKAPQEKPSISETHSTAPAEPKYTDGIPKTKKFSSKDLKNITGVILILVLLGIAINSVNHPKRKKNTVKTKLTIDSKVNRLILEIGNYQSDSLSIHPPVLHFKKKKTERKFRITPKETGKNPIYISGGKKHIIYILSSPFFSKMPDLKKYDFLYAVIEINNGQCLKTNKLKVKNII